MCIEAFQMPGLIISSAGIFTSFCILGVWNNSGVYDDEKLLFTGVIMLLASTASLICCG